MNQRFVPTDVAAAALGVKPATVRQWRKRKLLSRHGTPRRALVDLLECEAIACPEAA
jgi:hypothetical protein